jgi:hypothetical protein
MTDLATAYELAAEWHDKNARGCREIADDYLRVGDDTANKAYAAAQHHAASAAGLRLAAIEQRREGMVQ